MPYKDLEKRKVAFSNYYIRHKKEKKEYNSQYGKEKSLEISIKKKEYYLKNKEKIKEYREKNRDKLIAGRRKGINEYRYRRYREDIQFKIKSALRSRLKTVKNSKAGSSVKDLGCTVDEFKIYIESLWTEGMCWENWSRDGWHMDHIKPLFAFDLTDREQFLEAVHYKNLQPLWAKDNFKKNNKIL